MEDVNNKNRKLIKALELITDYELTKPLDKIDGDLIDSAVNWSLRLQNKDLTLSTEEIEKMVSMIPFTDTEDPETDKKVQKSVKVLKKKKVLFIAAIITILVTLLTVVSVAFECNIFEELKNRFGTVADMPVNEEIVVDGKTVIMFGGNLDYKTIEDALKSRSIDVLYTEDLPNEIYIEKIVYYNENNTNKLSYVMNNKTLVFNIVFNQGISESIQNMYETIIVNNWVCYVCTMPDLNQTQLYFEYKGNTYYFSYTDKQELIGIVENLKELE